MDSSEPSSSKQEEEDEEEGDEIGNNKQASSLYCFMSLRRAAPARPCFRYAQLFGIAAAATLISIVMMIVLIKHSRLLHHEFAVNHPEFTVPFSAMNPSKLLEEVLQNKNVYLLSQQLANQDWWNLFLNEYNITPPLRIPLPLMQKKRRPGLELAQSGATAKYPIIMIPGFVTSGLEFWSGSECARNQYHFRQRLWTAVGSAKSFLGDRECWRQHMLLHPFTGSDPDPQIRLRAASYVIELVWMGYIALYEVLLLFYCCLLLFFFFFCMKVGLTL
jgi:hypothetical protein